MAPLRMKSEQQKTVKSVFVFESRRKLENDFLSKHANTQSAMFNRRPIEN